MRDKGNLPRLSLVSAFLALFLLNLCCEPAHGGLKNAPAIERLYLSDDMRTARITFESPFPDPSYGTPFPENIMTLLHEKSGIKITYELTPEINGYTFYNYGLLLKRGDRVAVGMEGFFSAFEEIE